LNHAGKISHEMAKELAESEYDKFNTKRIIDSKKQLSDFDNALQQIESGKAKHKESNN